jgi:hypothetical protein
MIRAVATCPIKPKIPMLEINFCIERLYSLKTLESFRNSRQCSIPRKKWKRGLCLCSAPGNTNGHGMLQAGQKRVRPRNVTVTCVDLLLLISNAPLLRHVVWQRSGNVMAAKRRQRQRDLMLSGSCTHSTHVQINIYQLYCHLAVSPPKRCCILETDSALLLLAAVESESVCSRS